MLRSGDGLLGMVSRRHARVLEHLGRVVLGGVAPLIRGGARHCNVCGWNLRAFLPYGRFNLRWNAVCPHCQSLERHRLVWWFLTEESTYLKGPCRILHIAPESCYQERLRHRPEVRYVSGDLSSPAAEIKFDVEELPFADASFDGVICNHVLEHVSNDRRALREIRRVLAPGGWAILQSPLSRDLATTYEDPTILDPRERRRLFGQDDHVRLYGRDYPDRLKQAGFEVLERHPAKELGARETQRLGLDEEERLFVCRIAS